jgi:hypothetical protein
MRPECQALAGLDRMKIDAMIATIYLKWQAITGS